MKEPMSIRLLETLYWLVAIGIAVAGVKWLYERNPALAVAAAFVLFFGSQVMWQRHYRSPGQST